MMNPMSEPSTERTVMTAEPYIGGEQEPDAHRDTLLGQTAAGLSPESSDAVRREMDRRGAAGLPAVPEMSWDD